MNPGHPLRAGEKTDRSRVTVRFTPSELALLDQRRGGLSRAEYLRRVSVGEVKP